MARTKPMEAPIRRAPPPPPAPKLLHKRATGSHLRPGRRHKAKATTIAKRIVEKVQPLPKTQTTLPPYKADEYGMVTARFDGRTFRARRYRDHLTEVVNDLGGVDLCSHNQLLIARRVAGAAVMCEELEELWMGKDKRFSLDDYIKLTGLTQRLGNQLGLKRVPRPVGGGPAGPTKPDSLRQYLELSAEQRNAV